MTEAIKKFFNEYEIVFSALDVERQVPMFIQNPSADPKIIMFIAHQDEEKAMKDLGLM